MANQRMANSLIVTGLVACALALTVQAGVWDVFNPKLFREKDRLDITGLDGSDYFNFEYCELSDQLQRRVQPTNTTDLDVNIEMAARLYDHPKMSQYGNEEKFVDALRLFQSLSTVNLNNYCTIYSSNVLKENYLAAFGRPEWGFEQKLADRHINKIVGRLCRYHAEHCRNKYLPRFDEANMNVDETATAKVDQMIQQLIEKHQVESEKATTWTNAEQLFTFTKERRFMYLLIIQKPEQSIELITQLAGSDPDVKYLTTPMESNKYNEIDDDKVKGMVEKYLVEPCKTYMAPLKEVFVPAEFDAKFEVEIKQERIDYYQAWARYRYCRALTAGSFEIVHDITSMPVEA